MKSILLMCGLFFVMSYAFLSAQPLADGRDVFLGNIIGNPSNVPSDFLDLWNQVTPENAGKWGSVEYSRDKYNWAPLDKTYEFAKDNDLPFRQHHFVDNQQQPGWINTLDAEEIKAEVEEWIQLFGDRYPDADFIDVVNEPYKEPAEYKDALGGAGDTGYDWVIWCFEKAREYCPNAKLAVNEYGVLNGWTPINSYVDIINLLKDRNLIDAISVEGHFLESTTKSTIKSKLDQLAKTGLPIYINEYDVNIADDDQHLQRFSDQFATMYEHPAVKGITLWGYIEGAMWREDGYLVRRDGSDRKAMTWLKTYFGRNTGIAAQQSNPNEFLLEQNYPNPFNPTTTIAFNLQNKSDVKLVLYNNLGHIVQNVMSGPLDAGHHEFTVNGSELPSGLYFYKLTADGFSDMKKMALIK